MTSRKAFCHDECATLPPFEHLEITAEFIIAHALVMNPRRRSNRPFTSDIAGTHPAL